MNLGGGVHHFKIDQFGGLDMWLLPIMPRRLRLRVLAKKILRHHGSPEQIEKGVFTFSLPGEILIYEIIDSAGHVQPFSKGGG